MERRTVVVVAKRRTSEIRKVARKMAPPPWINPLRILRVKRSAPGAASPTRSTTSTTTMRWTRVTLFRPKTMPMVLAGGKRRRISKERRIPICRRMKGECGAMVRWIPTIVTMTTISTW
uniref:(northern house mosquito) hypothetical protein n=1 Tax=Culex pipiens TaxID=7175 RepID=A0A8D8B266_CULPI